MKKEGLVMYKSQLQEYAQKAGVLPPTYECVKEGLSHEPRFKSTVTVNNKSFESAPGFTNLRSAEHAAAKAALEFFQKSQASGVVPSPVHESGLCKNLLQEFAQKNGYPLPQYKMGRQGDEHSLTFVASVEIAGVSYSGGSAKSKKEAEIKAARTALLAIQATQPGVMALPPVEPVPAPTQGQGGQVANFVKSHARRKKRGRTYPVSVEEPGATRMKQSVGQILGPVQVQQMPQMAQIPQMAPLPQMNQVYQMPQMQQVPQMPHMQQMPQVEEMPQMAQVPQVSHTPQFLRISGINQVAQPLPGNLIVYGGQNVMPVEWNPKLGVNTRTAEVFSSPVQGASVFGQGPAMTAVVSAMTEPVAVQMEGFTTVPVSGQVHDSGAAKEEFPASQGDHGRVPVPEVRIGTSVAASS